MQKSNFFFALIAALLIGVGTMWAETVSWTAKSGALGSAISAKGETATGTIQTGDFEWSYTRTLSALPSGKTDNISFNKTSGYLQLGSKNAGEDLEFRTSAIPGTITSIVLEVGSKDGNHSGTVTVGGTNYNTDPNKLPTAAGDPPLGSEWKATGNSSGEIVISISCGGNTKYLLIKSITVTYEDQTKPQLTLSANELGFGTVKIGTSVEAKTFTLSGENLDNAHQVTLTAPTGFSVAPTAITPAEGAISETVTVTPSTAAAGTFNGSLTIKSEDLASDSIVNLKVKVGYEVKIATEDANKGTATLNGATDPVLVTGEESVRLEAIAKPGYEFDGWTFSGNAAEPVFDPSADEDETRVTVSESGTFTATFIEQSCTNLPAPTADKVEVSYTSATIYWNEVSNASKYDVKIKLNGETLESGLVSNVLYATANLLQPGTTYQYAVMAVGDGETYCDANNPALYGEFTTESYPSAVITLSENGVERILAGEYYQGDVVTLPKKANVGIKDKLFVGWSTESITEALDDQPTAGYYPAGSEYTLETNSAKFYAVYATAIEGEPSTWELVSTDLVQGSGSGYAAYDGKQTKDGIDYQIKNVMPEQGNVIQFKKSSGGIMYNETEFGADILSIELTGGQLTVYEGDEKMTEAPKNGKIDGTLTSPYKYEFSAGKRFFYMINASSGAVKLTKIAVNLKGAFNYSGYISVGKSEFQAPTFDVETPEFVETMNVAISSTVEGGEIYYQFNALPNPEVEAEKGIKYNGPFELNESATIYAYVTKDGVASPIANKTYTKLWLLTCEEFANLEVGEKAALGEVTVTYVNGKNIWVLDEDEGALMIYDSGNNLELKAGDVVNGLIGTKAIHNVKVHEIEPTVGQAALNIVAGAAPQPAEFTEVPSVGDINRYIVLRGVKMEGAFTTTASGSITGTVGEATVEIRNQFRIGQQFDGSLYDIVGLVMYYTDHIQVYYIGLYDQVTGLDQIENGKCANEKMIVNGMLIIEHNGVRYNTLGQQIQ